MRVPKQFFLEEAYEPAHKDIKEELLEVGGKRKKVTHKKKKLSSKQKKAFSGKMHKVMHEYKEGELHAGSRKGPKVRSKKQAVAIAYSEARKAERNVKRRKSGQHKFKSHASIR